MSRQWILIGMGFAATCWALVLSFNAANSKQDEIRVGSPGSLRGSKEESKKLGGEDRYLTCLSTDKPIYRIGEKVYVRGVILNAASHKPLANGASANPTIEIRGPKGDVVAGGRTSAENSVWSFAWEIPDGQAGGEYKVQASYPFDGHAPAERKFDIRAYRAPRLKSQITFLKDGYGPGDKVRATLDVKRAEGGVPEGARVSVNAVVDGMQISAPPGKVDANGLCSVNFDLPAEIARGEGTLALVIEDGGVVETAAKTIPILLQTVDLSLYPEGGELVAGYKNRVYFQAKQPNGKPADLSGKVYIEGETVQACAEFSSQHEGRGKFEFVPEANKEYYLSISEPKGIKTHFKLPEVKASGAVIQADKEVYEAGETVDLHIGCNSKKFKVSASKREAELASFDVDLSKRNDIRPGTLHPFSFTLPEDVDGVLRVTVIDEEKQAPVAERLVFRKASNPLNISIKADKTKYVPGDRARLTVKATDKSGKPQEAVLGLTVTDDSVLEMIEKREQAPHLPVMVFLEPEVDDLADAHVYLDTKDPNKAALATDLLLATQGWRRFIFVEPDKFIAEQGDKARRALALKIQSQVEIQEAAQLAQAMDGAAPGMGGMGGMFFAANEAAEGPVPPAAAMPQALPAPPMPMAMATGGEGPRPEEDAGNFMEDEKSALGKIAADAELNQFRPVLAERQANFQAGQASASEQKLQDAIAVASRAKKRAFIAKEEMAIGKNNLIAVREYAHKQRENRQPSDRVDFTETLYWSAGVKTDPTSGEASIAFDLNDSVSTFKVFADAFANSGSIGAENITIESVQPFYAEAKMPLEVSSGDKILLPVSLVNASGNSLSGCQLEFDLKGEFKLKEQNLAGQDLQLGERKRILQEISVGDDKGEKDFVLSAKAGSFSDKISRKLSVKPKGFPIEQAFGGMIGPDKPAVHKILIPGEMLAASMGSKTAVYPTPLANLTEALERLIQDPYGCFEQTSSTSYPLTMAQQYFLSHTGIKPELIERSKQKLDDGYKKLVGFWCPDRGYEWFGENPGHEALTAYGLLHFSDMSQVKDVDQTMLVSTREWLMKQKDGSGGFTRKRRALHTWSEDKDASNAYILWALLESGQPSSDLKAEIDSLKAAAFNSQNSYVGALAANALYLAGEKAEAKKLMDKLAAKQKPDGKLDGIKSSIVGSGGESLDIEGTSLATLAWLRDPAYAGNVENSIKFLADSCKAGRYGSTQATVLALRAIVTYDKQRARPKAPGKVRVYVDGQPVGDWREFSPSSEGAIKLPDISELMTPGEHKLELRMEGGAEMPYSLAVNYNTLKPASSQDCKLDLAISLAQNKLSEGAATEALVKVRNKSKDVLPTPVAIIGLPGGLEPRHDQLKELVKKGKIDTYEVIGREVVLYWRTLNSEATVDLPISLIAAIPGKYTGPASRAYLYYTDEHKNWVDGMQVEIAAK